MNIQRSLKLFLVMYPLYVLIDFAWFGFVMNATYQEQLGHLMRAPEGCNWVVLKSIFVALALIMLGMIVFVTDHVELASYKDSFLWGAFYGCITYGVYATSSYAFFAGWPIFITLIDFAWGITLMGCFGLLLSYLLKNIFKKA